MNFWDKVMVKWKALGDLSAPTLKKMKQIGKQSQKVARIAWKHLFAMRKIFVSIPIAVFAVVLAVRNQANLPAVVGLGLQNNGSFSIQIMRELAVLGPLAITALCLLLVFCSKRILTPWLVSAFSLVLPLFIWIINVFPA